MKKRLIVICSLLAFVALGVFVVSIQAGPRSAEPTVDSQIVSIPAANRQTNVSCNLCFELWWRLADICRVVELTGARAMRLNGAAIVPVALTEQD